MAPYRVALIGTGRVGYQFSFSDLPDNHAAALVQHPSCQLVAGVNRGRDKLEAFGERFGVRALYRDYQQMLAEIQPDICIVATHPELHAEMVEGCAQAEATKAIICEKPMALSLAECDRMIAACQAGGITLQINHNRRWHPEWILAKKLLDEGAIGELNHIYCYMDGGKPAPWWRSENEGPLLHDFTHYFDLMDLFAGEVEWLSGMAEQRSRPWAVEDFSAAMLKFKNGVTGLICGAELTQYSDHAFELRGTTGLIRMDPEQVCLFQSKVSMSEPDSGFEWSSLEEVKVERPAPASTYVAALAELVDTLEGKGSLRSDGAVGRRSLEMVMAIYQSQLEGNGPVHFPVSLAESGVGALRRDGQFTAREK
ncbi:MAG: Gfo/Idh/MocA family oxidoreductase [Candidatus Latescibacterota bacterium]|nr:Gfo/Idh/MocA family oxidoreductase [Candidatus Latescibacterota bacterium]